METAVYQAVLKVYSLLETNIGSRVQVFTFKSPLQAGGSCGTLDILSAGFPNYKIELRKHTLLYKERSAIPGWIYAEMR